MNKIVKGSPWTYEGKEEISLSKAIEGSMRDRSTDAETVAILVQLLVDAKVLTLDQIKPMLSSNYTVEE